MILVLLLSQTLVHRAPNPEPSAAYRWLDVVLEASGRDVDRNRARPTILSRSMAIVLTSMYDAWAAYDDRAVGTQLGATLRRPAKERTLANKEKAIAFAALRSLEFVYPEDRAWLHERMRSFGYDPNDASTASAIGNSAADAVIAFRKHDGANQLGDEGDASSAPYSDYTGYQPINTPDKITDPTRWMPIPFAGGKAPGFLTAHWYRVKPFALERSDQFRPPPPPVYGSKQLAQEIDEIIRVNANLTLEQKAIVELMRDGPRSTGQSGHWLQFAQDVSRRDRYDLDRDIKLFFSVANVVFDAFIACWDAKRHYDTGRPYWWVRIKHRGEKLEGWMGPGRGVGMLTADQWHPYSPDSFVTPPFPGYTSGHASASGAAARILELFTASDRFGAVAIVEAGAFTEPDFSPQQMQARSGKLGPTASKQIHLPLPTFTATAEMAAVSRLWGGYHIRTDNDEGLILGRKVAIYSWPKYTAYFNGSAPTLAVR